MIQLYVPEHVVSVVYSVSWMVRSNIVIGQYVPETWSVLCVPYLVGGIF